MTLLCNHTSRRHIHSSFGMKFDWSSSLGWRLSLFSSSILDPPAVPETNPSDPSSEEVITPSKTESGLEASTPTKMDTARKSTTPKQPDVIPKSPVTPTPRSSGSPQHKKGGYLQYFYFLYWYFSLWSGNCFFWPLNYPLPQNRRSEWSLIISSWIYTTSSWTNLVFYGHLVDLWVANVAQIWLIDHLGQAGLGW